jgi:hypothetical protein
MNSIGVRNVGNIDAMLDSHAIWPFTHVVGPLLKSTFSEVVVADSKQDHFAWSKEQVGWLTATAKQEARDVSLKLYIELSVQVLTPPMKCQLTSSDTLFGVAKDNAILLS